MYFIKINTQFSFLSTIFPLDLLCCQNLISTLLNNKPISNLEYLSHSLRYAYLLTLRVFVYNSLSKLFQVFIFTLKLCYVFGILNIKLLSSPQFIVAVLRLSVSSLIRSSLAVRAAWSLNTFFSASLSISICSWCVILQFLSGFALVWS